MKSQATQLPWQSGDGYSYGGGWVVTCPMIVPAGSGSTSATFEKMLAIPLGEISDGKHVAEFIRDAINEKLERDFTNSA